MFVCVIVVLCGLVYVVVVGGGVGDVEVVVWGCGDG